MFAFPSQKFASFTLLHPLCKSHLRNPEILESGESHFPGMFSDLLEPPQLLTYVVAQFRAILPCKKNAASEAHFQFAPFKFTIKNTESVRWL